MSKKAADVYVRDLEWFFDDSEGDLGKKGQSYDVETKSRGQAPQGYSDDTFRDCKRYRQIESAFYAIPECFQLVLKQAHKPRSSCHVEKLRPWREFFGAQTEVAMALLSTAGWATIVRLPASKASQFEHLKKLVKDVHKVALSTYVETFESLKIRKALR